MDELSLSQPLPLTPLECVLKRLAIVYLRGDCSREEMEAYIWQMLGDAPQGRDLTLAMLSDTMDVHLLDADFIPPHASMAMMRHARYMPANLHSHTFFEVLYVARGSCINVFPDGLLQLQPGELLFIPPGLSHAISVFDDDTNLVNFMIRSEALQNAVLLEPYFRILMIYLLRDYADRLQLRQVQSLSQPIDIVLQYLHADPATVTLSDLACRLGYSYEHLSRMIKAATGKTFSTLRRDIRLQRAAQLLRSTSRPVEDIALACGYETRSQFYAQFKAVYGQTPAHYREGT